jgi:hypothetical protein
MSLLDPFGAVSAGGGMISSFLHPEKGYENAQKAASRGFEEAKQYQLPFQQWGMQVHPNLAQSYLDLSNPTKLQGEWANAYEMSPQAQRAMDFSKNQGLEQASSMGLMGSSGALNNLQQGAGDIMLQDRRNFLNDLMQKYMAGIGLGTNIYNVGAQSGRAIGDQAARHGENMAQLAYGKTNAPGEMFGGLLGTGAKMLGGMFGGF